MRGERSVQRLVPLRHAGLTGYLTPALLREEVLLQSLMWKHVWAGGLMGTAITVTGVWRVLSANRTGSTAWKRASRPRGLSLQPRWGNAISRLSRDEGAVPWLPESRVGRTSSPPSPPFPLRWALPLRRPPAPFSPLTDRPPFAHARRRRDVRKHGEGAPWCAARAPGRPSACAAAEGGNGATRACAVVRRRGGRARSGVQVCCCCPSLSGSSVAAPAPPCPALRNRRSSSTTTTTTRRPRGRTPNRASTVSAAAVSVWKRTRMGRGTTDTAGGGAAVCEGCPGGRDPLPPHLPFSEPRLAEDGAARAAGGQSAAEGV